MEFVESLALFSLSTYSLIFFMSLVLIGANWYTAFIQ